MPIPAFDPRKAFDVVNVPAFDPSKPHEVVGEAAPAAHEEPGILESLLRGAAQTFTGSLADEITGGAEALATKGLSILPGSNVVAKPYAQARDESRAAYHAADEANPVASNIGKIAGGLGSVFVPGLGAVGSGLGGALLTGAKLGAINAFGDSEAHNAEDLAWDTAKGGMTGAAVGGGLNVAGRVAGTVVGKVGKVLEESTNPAIQRLMAMGAKSRDLATDLDKKRLIGMHDELSKMGAFAKNANGQYPDLPEIAQWLNTQSDRVVTNMQNKLQAAGTIARIDQDAISDSVRAAANQVIARQPATEQKALKELVEQNVVAPLLEGGGNLSKAWTLKQRIGDWVGPAFAKTRSPAEMDVYKAAYGVVRDAVVQATEQVEQQLGGEAGASLGKLGKQYAAITMAKGMVGKQLANDAMSSNIIGAKLGDAPAASLAATLGGAIAGAPGVAAGYGGATLANAAMRTTEGRLMRAAAGEKLGQTVDNTMAILGRKVKAAADTAAQQAAPQAIPRTVDGVKAWVAQNMPMIAKMAPQLAPIAQRLQAEPPFVAERTIRTVMPMIAQMMTPSVYQSELDGKVSEPQDKLTITQQLQQVPGLTPTQVAVKRSRLNKTGDIPPEVYVPPGLTSQSLDDQYADFSARLKSMGY